MTRSNERKVKRVTLKFNRRVDRNTQTHRFSEHKVRQSKGLTRRDTQNAEQNVALHTMSEKHSRNETDELIMVSEVYSKGLYRPPIYTKYIR